MEFELHERLARDSLPVGRFPLGRLLLINDSRYPWCVLVPARAGIREIHQLAWEDQVQLLRESGCLARGLEALFSPDKLNLAAIGNLVPQLHLHHVVRYTGDAAWPGPVWGVGAARPYEAAAGAERIRRLVSWLRGPDAGGLPFEPEPGMRG